VLAAGEKTSESAFFLPAPTETLSKFLDDTPPCIVTRSLVSPAGISEPDY
jgi:hypothetical protein